MRALIAFPLARLLRAIADRLDPCDAHIMEALAKAGLDLPKGCTLSPVRTKMDLRFNYEAEAQRMARRERIIASVSKAAPV